MDACHGQAVGLAHGAKIHKQNPRQIACSPSRRRQPLGREATEDRLEAGSQRGTGNGRVGLTGQAAGSWPGRGRHGTQLERTAASSAGLDPPMSRPARLAPSLPRFPEHCPGCGRGSTTPGPVCPGGTGIVPAPENRAASSHAQGPWLCTAAPLALVLEPSLQGLVAAASPPCEALLALRAGSSCPPFWNVSPNRP